MNYKMYLVTVPLDRHNSMKYFVYNNLSVESGSIMSDDLFQKLINNIPELKEYIELELNHRNYIVTDSISALHIVFDFSDYEEMLFYYKLSQPENFEHLLNLEE